MKSSHRLGLLVAVVATSLLVLTGVAMYGLARLGSGVLAVAVGIAGAAAVLAVAVAWSLAREAEQQLGELLPPLPEETQPRAPVPRAGFRLREARPGEVPEAYLAAVRKGAQARRAAWKAGADPH
jgi:hypothetical protein